VGILLSELLRRYVGGGLFGRIAAAGVLRLALRWPALAAVVIVAGLVARIAADRQRRSGGREGSAYWPPR
jgi:hypothetical protein